jgi:hypothetical protein
MRSSLAPAVLAATLFALPALAQVGRPLASYSQSPAQAQSGETYTYKVTASASIPWLTTKGMVTRQQDRSDNDWRIELIDADTGKRLARNKMKAANPDLHIQWIFKSPRDIANITLRVVEADALFNDRYDLDTAAVSPQEPQVRVGMECSDQGSTKVIDRISRTSSSTYDVLENGQIRQVTANSYEELSHVVSWSLRGSCYSMIVQRIN